MTQNSVDGHLKRVSLDTQLSLPAGGGFLHRACPCTGPPYPSPSTPSAEEVDVLVLTG